MWSCLTRVCGCWTPQSMSGFLWCSGISALQGWLLSYRAVTHSSVSLSHAFSTAPA